MGKHKITVALLVLYYVWFAYVVWHMITGTDNEGEGLRLVTMIVISAIVGGLYLCVFLFRVLASKEPFRENAVFLWLILLPVLVQVVYHLSR